MNSKKSRSTEVRKMILKIMCMDKD